MNALVTITDGQAVTTTLAIAEGTGIEHKAVIQLARTYLPDLEEFGRVTFEMRPFETAGGTQRREVAVLNEQQSTLLLTYMRNSEIVRAFKKRLVKEFWQMAERLRGQPAIPQTLPEALRLAAEAIERNEKLALENKAQAEALDEAAPKVQALELISAGKDSLTLTQAAKVLGVKISELTTRMHAEGWIYRQNGTWVGYDYRIKSGALSYKEANYTDEKTGLACIKPYCHVTPKGLVKLAVMFGVSLPPDDGFFPPPSQPGPRPHA